MCPAVERLVILLLEPRILFIESLRRGLAGCLRTPNTRFAELLTAGTLTAIFTKTLSFHLFLVLLKVMDQRRQNEMMYNGEEEIKESQTKVRSRMVGLAVNGRKDGSRRGRNGELGL